MIVRFDEFQAVLFLFDFFYRSILSYYDEQVHKIHNF